MNHKVKAWVLFDGGTKFGGGRAELLRLVEAEGSLQGAVGRMEMSYRAAWGYLRELEEAAGFALVERVGRGASGGTRLTPRGRAFLAAFDRFRARLDAAAEREFGAAFASFLEDGAGPRARRRGPVRPAKRAQARAAEPRSKRRPG